MEREKMESSLEQWISRKKECLSESEIIKNERLEDFVKSLRGVIFPGYWDEIEDKNTYFDLKFQCLRKNLNILLNEISIISKKQLDVTFLTDAFIKCLPKLDELVYMDLDSLYEGDPAAENKAEIILCYPGMFAIFIYRVSHALYQLNIPILPRVLSEYVHRQTGIDIHPGAKIGHHFFIDHGTGIVIGETTVIGNYVKIYQGVTLGALSLSKGQALKGTKRHPTIEDNVTIYSGASIFGGNTIIGKNTTLGSSVFITESVAENMIVTTYEAKKKDIKK